MNNINSSQTVQRLNDEFRRTGAGGHQMITHGIQEMGLASVAQLRLMIAAYQEFSEENDPHQEHDFGSLAFQGQWVFWKIDDYDKTLTKGSPNPCDQDVTTRVLTIMLAREY